MSATFIDKLAYVHQSIPDDVAKNDTLFAIDEKLKLMIPEFGRRNQGVRELLEMRGFLKRAVPHEARRTVKTGILLPQARL